MEEDEEEEEDETLICTNSQHMSLMQMAFQY